MEGQVLFRKMGEIFRLDDLFLAFAGARSHPCQHQRRSALLLKIFKLHRIPRVCFDCEIGRTDQAVQKLARILEDRIAVVLANSKTHSVINQSEKLELP